METNKKHYIKVDKIKTKIPYKYCKVPQSLSYNRLKYFNHQNRDDGLEIEFSGKIFATPTELGNLNKYNKDLLADKIFEISGIKIESFYLLNFAPIYRVDVIEDIIVADKPCHYISEVREILKACTNRYDVYTHKGLTYINGLSVVPKSLNNQRLSIYAKGNELRKHRNKEFRNIFDYEFLEQTNKMLRFEYIIRKFKDIRQVFGLGEGAYINISKILDCEQNVVADFFEKLMT